MEGLIMTSQLILGLSILVVLHELGHFIPAKLFGMRVEKFFLFFDAWGFKLISKKIGGTLYGIGWLPLGGYVKISGMVDESLDTEALSKPAEPHEFRAKPAWQRLIVMLGGVTVNVITGIVIFIGLTYFLGERYLSVKEAKYGIVANPIAQEIGLKTGDKILKLNGVEILKFNEIFSPDAFLNADSYYTVDRNGELITIKIPKDFVNKLSDKKNQQAFVEPIFPFEVGKVMPGTAAAKSGMKDGDKITAINNKPILYFHELQAALLNQKSKEIIIGIDRKGVSSNLNAIVSAEGKLGFQVASLLKESTEKFGLAQSAAAGTEKAFTILVVQVKAFKKMFAGEMDVSKSLSGPIGIAQQFGGTWDWVKFWSLTGLLSMGLAFMNLLPIPALDGGHVMFLIYEMVARRKPSDKFLEISQKIGMAILFGLMFYSVFNDVFKLIF